MNAFRVVAHDRRGHGLCDACESIEVFSETD